MGGSNRNIHKRFGFGFSLSITDFIIPKPNKTTRIVSDFRQVNSKLVRTLFPISKISDIMQELEDFIWSSMLN